MCYHAAKFGKKSLEACIILGHNWAKIAYLAKKGIFLEIHSSDFYLFNVSYHATKFEKNP